MQGPEAVRCWAVRWCVLGPMPFQPLATHRHRAGSVVNQKNGKKFGGYGRSQGWRPPWGRQGLGFAPSHECKAGGGCGAAAGGRAPRQQRPGAAGPLAPGRCVLTATALQGGCVLGRGVSGERQKRGPAGRRHARVRGHLWGAVGAQRNRTSVQGLPGCPLLLAAAHHALPGSE